MSQESDFLYGAAKLLHEEVLPEMPVNIAFGTVLSYLENENGVVDPEKVAAAMQHSQRALINRMFAGVAGITDLDPVHQEEQCFAAIKASFADLRASRK